MDLNPNAAMEVKIRTNKLKNCSTKIQPKTVEYSKTKNTNKSRKVAL